VTLARRLSVGFIVICGLWPTAFNAAADRPVAVAVLIAEESPAVRDVLAGFRAGIQASGRSLELKTISVGPTATGTLKDAVGKADVVMALGSAANDVAARELSPLPIVSTLVLQSRDLKHPNVTGVYLEFPVDVELRFMRRILPKSHRVGILFSAGNQERVAQASKIAASLGLDLHQRHVDAPRDLPTALDAFANDVEVLWGIPDAIVLTPETARSILVYAFKQRIAFVGPSASWVRAGALYALDRDYEDIGLQCAQLTLNILGGQPASSLPPVAPRKVLYSINTRTAAQLKIDISPDLRLGASAVVE
jgi:putative tryptophan/tyrosine transport system substrate-binding protein